MAKIPTISVVMPAYNAEKYLREAIDSILAQTFTDFEFIIINDGSTDSTKKIIQSYDDPRIVYLENEVNSGICVTLNKGLDAARGRYIARMDSDDISLPQRFEKQIAFMDSNPEIGVVGTHLQLMDENGNFTYVFKNASNPKECYVNMIFASCVGHPSVMIRTSCLRDNDLNYEEYFKGMEDYYLWWQLNKHTQISNIPEPLLNYRCHSRQITKNQVNADFLRRQREFLAIRLKDSNLNLPEEEIDLLNQYMINSGGFNDDKLMRFIAVLKKIQTRLSESNPELKSLLKLYMAKVISLAMDRSFHNLSKSKFYYTNKSLRVGCMPFLWWLKRTYHYIYK